MPGVLVADRPAATEIAGPSTDRVWVSGACHARWVEPQDLVLTMLCTHGVEPHERLWSGGLVRLLGDFGFSLHAARAALARLTLRRILVRHRDGRTVDYAISPGAYRRLVRIDRRMRTFGRATSDGAWTLLVHTLPPASSGLRGRLAAGLRFLGLGPIQPAVWLGAGDSEADVRLLLEDLGLERLATISLGRMCRGLGSTASIARAWDLSAARRRYRELLDAYEIDEHEPFVTHTHTRHALRGLCALDPELPDELSPDLATLRLRAIATIDDLDTGLTERARAYFREATGAPHGHRGANGS